MNLCKCGCGKLCAENYKRGCGRRGKKSSEEHNRILSERIKNYKQAINPSNIVRKLKENYLDHSYSKFDGFKNNIPPCIIGHPVNLKLLSNSINCSKNTKSDIVLEEFINKIISFQR